MQLPKLLPKFLEQYPKVRLQLNISNRRVDIINEGYDVALRVRSRLDDDGSLVMRSFGGCRNCWWPARSTWTAPAARRIRKS
jgi:DNA-binding transcriptional LysR family regulator